jgi:hypothetical protein
LETAACLESNPRAGPSSAEQPPTMRNFRCLIPHLRRLQLYLQLQLQLQLRLHPTTLMFHCCDALHPLPRIPIVIHTLQTKVNKEMGIRLDSVGACTETKPTMLSSASVICPLLVSGRSISQPASPGQPGRPAS